MDGRMKTKGRVEMLKRIGIFVILLLFLGQTVFSFYGEGTAFAAEKELRGIWVSVFDFPKLGLNASSESGFVKNAQKFLDKAEENGVNTVFLHVRAFDDAIYPSKVFRRNQYVSSAYDPLKLMVREAHKRGMELHAWMNPYRLDYEYYLDPAKASSTERVKTAVSEVMAYDIDGIHFDDYFYNAKTGYKDVSGAITVQGGQEPSAERKKSYVNTMVRAVYREVKSKKASVDFGISPQGTTENCRLSGADIDTWMSQKGYVDYLMPQIYWSNQYGSAGNRAMFSDRGREWSSLNSGKVTLYAGLALYRTGTAISDDPGWKKKSTNLKEQVQILRNSGWAGYTLFSAQDLARDTAQAELSGLRTLLGSVQNTAKPAAVMDLKVSSAGYRSLKLSWKQASGAGSYEIYRASSQNGSYQKVKTAVSPNCQDTGLETGKNYYYRVRAVKNGQYGEWSQIKSGKPKLAAPKLSVSAGKKRAALKWNKIAGASGYQVYRADKSKGSFKRISTVKKGATTKYINAKLKKGKKYTFRIRAYRSQNGKKLYGGYSSRITVKIK